mmetsp:Transcript_126898/g.224965  ORF Transcript_126898/g.224965 Transcript_126898/m.224965 type:complete len:281 (-) Transcript_126898:36-878(-)
MLSELPGKCFSFLYSTCISSLPFRSRRRTKDHQAFAEAWQELKHSFKQPSSSMAKVSLQKCQLLCGRFLVQRADDEFGPRLTHPSKQLAWVLTGRQLFDLQGRDCVDVARRLAQSHRVVGELQQGLAKMRLYVFPCSSAVLCDWDSFLDLINQTYGNEVGGRLDVHRKALKTTPFSKIVNEDPALQLGELEQVVGGSSVFGNPGLFDTRRYLQSANRLIDARAFLYHELGLNSEADLPYTKNRTAIGATLAYMVPNWPLQEVAEHTWVDIPGPITELHKS